MKTPLKLILLSLFSLAFVGGLIYAPSYLQLSYISTFKETIGNMYQTHPLLFSFAFIMLYALQAALALPTSAALTLAGGFFMGTIPALICVVLGATLGASLLFILAKSTIGGPLQRKVQRYIPAFKDRMEARAFHYLLFLRLVPVFPFFAVNILPSLFNIPLRTFVTSTLIGIIPGTAVYCYIGATLTTLSTPQDIISVRMLFAFTLLGALALLPTFIKKKDKPHA